MARSPTYTHRCLCRGSPPKAVLLISIISFLAIVNCRICASLMRLGGGRYGTRGKELIVEVSLSPREALLTHSLIVILNRDSSLRPFIPASFYSRSPLPKAPEPQDSTQSILRQRLTSSQWGHYPCSSPARRSKAQYRVYLQHR